MCITCAVLNVCYQTITSRPVCGCQYSWQNPSTSDINNRRWWRGSGYSEGKL
jgi:hypothetical protein